jgi:hypothetical protein
MGCSASKDGGVVSPTNGNSASLDMMIKSEIERLHYHAHRIAGLLADWEDFDDFDADDT